MAGEYVGWSKLMGLAPYGDYWRQLRKLLFQYIGTRAAVEKFYPLEELETRQFLARTMNNPDALAEEIRRMVGSVIVMITHGYTVQSSPDPILGLAEKVMDEFCILTTPGSFLVDVFPSLRHVPSWMPGAAWKRIARQWRRNFDDMCEIPHELVKSSIEEGKATHNFTTQLLEDPSLDDETIKRAGASLYAGGADTTVAALHTLFLVLLLHPEVQRKAQAEIDRVIGTDRLPTLSDRDDLPYVNAVCAESLRWKPLSAMGVPHCVTQDDVYEGVFIPKGSVVVPNLWQMLHDPETYTEPEKFNPDRYMPDFGKGPEPHPRAFAFGFGRRVCPGIQLAEAAMFITAATTLAAFNISNAVENGVKIIPTGEMKDNGVISHPQPFKFCLQPRSEKAKELILSAE